MALLKLDKERRPRVLLVPPPDLPVPAVQGGAVETLLTHLIRENEKQGQLDLLCASVTDDAARRAAEGWQHTKMLYINRPGGHRRYWPMVFLERCAGIAAPYDPWYQKVQLSLALELPPPDLIVAEGGNLTQCSAISRMFGRKRCLAHLHGQTTCTPVMDDIYGGVLALSDFIRENYLQSSTLDPQRAYILHNCIDTARFCPGPASKTLRAQLGFTDEDFVVLYCGRLDPDKGIHKLMEAIAALHEPHIKLLIVGSPFFARTQQSAFQRKLEQQAKSLGNRVQFTGYIPNEDLPDYYRLADLCCVPTLVEEAAGLVAVEAMACGRPVLATRSGGMPEYLAGSQAVLVERGDTVTDQLAWSIRMLYEHPALCTEMGAAGAARGREFSTARFCPGPASKTLRAQLGFTDEDFVVLYCGRLDPDKGIHKLMEAIAALHEPHIKLLIVGSPFFARTQQSAFQRKLEQQAKSLGNRVQFTGYIPNEDLPDYYRLADLCCVPTLVEEAAGLVAVEAMACGRPVLATRSGGMPEYLAGSQAVLVERGDTVTDQLAWSIRMLYEHPALCTEMGAAGAARGREFSTAHYYEEFVRIVRDVTENGGAQ